MSIKFHFDLPSNISHDQFSNECTEKFILLRDQFLESFSLNQLQLLYDNQTEAESLLQIKKFLIPLYEKEIKDNGFTNFFADTIYQEKFAEKN